MNIERLKQKPILLAVVLAIICGCFLMTGCGAQNQGPGQVMAVSGSATGDEDGQQAGDNSGQQPGEAEGRQEEAVLELAVVGDIMVHSNLLAAAYDKKSGKYSFDGFFDEVSTYLVGSDLTVGNLETTLAGKNRKYTGYPKFNTPEEILPALTDAGFDVLTSANNHSLDRGEAGVIETIANLREAGLRHTGTAAGAGERARMLIEDVKGIKVGILAYTYGTNGIPIPKGKGYLVNRLDPRVVAEDIRKIRAAGAEAVLVFPHFGVEYRRIPGEAEKKLVNELFNAGADIIAASHTHVLQPMVIRDSSKVEKGMFAAYSLGNFVSGQKGIYRESSVILKLKLKKEPGTGEIKLVDAGYIPTWVHEYKENGRTRFRVLAVEKALRDYRKGLDKRITAQDYMMLDEVWKETVSHLSGPGSPRLINI